MPRASKVESQENTKVEALPESFHPSQLFICVSDAPGAAAGFDGGPEVGGSGAWARGDVRQWTSSHAVPLALRDPEDGMIVRGYLEPVESRTHGPDGKPLTVSRKYYAVREKSGKSFVWTAAAPSAQAVERASRGPESVTKPLQPLGGTFLPQSVTPATQRAMDSGVAVG